MPHRYGRLFAVIVVLSLLVTAISAFSHDEPAVHRHRHRYRQLAGNSTISTTPSTARYGHSSLYLREQRTVLFIGGQVGPSDTVVTNDVFSLSLDSASSSTAITPRPDLTAGLPPQAWAAVALDAKQFIWSIGGVTQDCSRDSVAYTLNVSTWATEASASRLAGGWNPLVAPEAQDGNNASTTSSSSFPPRRRQAAAVAVKDGEDIWVFGGVSGPYTCSLDTVAYAGMDKWATGTPGAVQSLGWDMDLFQRMGVSAPFSDYGATAIDDGVRVVLVGGQAADGSFLNLTSLLVFDTQAQSWTVEVCHCV
jgi:hypothetical protein